MGEGPNGSCQDIAVGYLQSAAADELALNELILIMCKLWNNWILTLARLLAF